MSTTLPKPKTAQSATKFKLVLWHYTAIELRYEGKTYAEIAEALTSRFNKNFKEQRMRRWFALGGVLEKEYIDFAKKENERRRQVVLEELKKLIPKIPLTFNALLERKDREGNKKLDAVTISALKLLCEILNFKVEPGSDTTNPVDEYFDRVEEELEAES